MTVTWALAVAIVVREMKGEGCKVKCMYKRVVDIYHINEKVAVLLKFKDGEMKGEGRSVRTIWVLKYTVSMRRL